MMGEGEQRLSLYNSYLSLSKKIREHPQVVLLGGTNSIFIKVNEGG